MHAGPEGVGVDRPEPSMISRRRLIQVAAVTAGGVLVAPALWPADAPTPGVPKPADRIAPRDRLPASAAGQELLILLNAGSNPCHLSADGIRLTDVSVSWDASVRGTMVTISYARSAPPATGRRLLLKLLGSDRKALAEELFDFPRPSASATGPLGTTSTAFDVIRWGTRKIGPHSRLLSLTFVD